MINLKYNLEFMQKGGSVEEEKQEILGVGMYSTDDRFISFIYKDITNPLSDNEKNQIKAVYESNPDTTIKWTENMSDQNQWNFQLLKIRNRDDYQGSEKIIGVAGINLEDRELGYDAIFHSDEEKRGIHRSSGYIGFLNKGYYRQLCAERVKNVQMKHPTKSFFLFTQHKRLLKTHIDSGLELLDVMPPAGDGTFTCRYSGRIYTRIDGSDYALRLLCDNHKPDNGDANKNKFPNFVQIPYKNRDHPGLCSGMYIGNGIIITAAHCLKPNGDENLPDEVGATVILDPYGPQRAEIQGRYHYYLGRTFQDTWKDIAIIVIDKNSIFDMQLAKIPILADPVNLPPQTHLDLDNEIPDLFMYGFPGGGVRQVTINKQVLNPILTTIPRLIAFMPDIYDFGEIPIGYPDNAQGKINFVRDEFKKRFTCTNLPAVQGDSGGPLYLKEKNNKILIGSVLGAGGGICPSFFINRALSGVSFFNTSFLKDFILQKIINRREKGNELFFYNWQLEKTLIYTGDEQDIVPRPGPGPVPGPRPIPTQDDMDYINFLTNIILEDTFLKYLNEHRKKLTSIINQLSKIVKDLEYELSNVNEDGMDVDFYKKKELMITNVKAMSRAFGFRHSLDNIETFYTNFSYKHKSNKNKINLVKAILWCNIGSLETF